MFGFAFPDKLEAGYGGQRLETEEIVIFTDSLKQE